MRMNMMGKRVNFACRSVISPDPFMMTSEGESPLTVTGYSGNVFVGFRGSARDRSGQLASARAAPAWSLCLSAHREQPDWSRIALPLAPAQPESRNR